MAMEEDLALEGIIVVTVQALIVKVVVLEHINRFMAMERPASLYLMENTAQTQMAPIMNVRMTGIILDMKETTNQIMEADIVPDLGQDHPEGETP